MHLQNLQLKLLYLIFNKVAESSNLKISYDSLIISVYTIGVLEYDCFVFVCFLLF